MTDDIFQKEFETRLPQAVYNLDNGNYELLLVITLTDSLGATKDITKRLINKR